MNDIAFITRPSLAKYYVQICDVLLSTKIDDRSTQHYKSKRLGLSYVYSEWVGLWNLSVTVLYL